MRSFAAPLARRNQLIALGLAVAMGVLANMAMDVDVTTLFYNFELKTIDYRFQWRGRRQPSPEILIVAIDEASIQDPDEEFGQWPWRRSVHAELVRVLHEARVAQIGFDVFFAEPDRFGQSEDRELARAMAEAGNVFCAMFGLEKERAPRPTPPEAEAAMRRFAVESPALDLAAGRLPDVPYARPPLPEITAACAGLGFVDFPADADNVYRRVPLLATHEGKLYPALGLAMAAARLNVDLNDIEVVLGSQLALGPGSRIPLDERGRLWIDFAGGARTFPRESYADVLKGRVPQERLTGRIVLVGATATGLGDIRACPFGGGRGEKDLFYGVEHQANILASLLEGRGLRPISPPLRIGLVYLLALLAGLIVPRTRPLWAAAGAVAVLLAYDMLALRLFASHGIVLEVVPQNGALVLTTAAILVTRLRGEEHEKQALRESMQYYLPAHVVDELVARPGAVTLGGERREISVLFCDIRDFTAFAEKVHSEETVALLNRFFDAMDDVVWRHEGLIDKYMGDCVMAIFGAPHDQPDHAARAVGAALDMQQEVEATEGVWEFLGFEGMRVGIGVATGQATVGNVGSSRLIQYTAVGDTVNLASRLEQLTKEHNVPVLVSAETRAQAPEVAVYREVGKVGITRIEGPAPIYSAARPHTRTPRRGDVEAGSDSQQHEHAGD
ncbi:MAG: CHASE2 domain-containing protein [Armatimonadota bacterium]